MSVRAPAVAGAFYPGEAETLRRAVLGYMDAALAQPGWQPLSGLRALVVPHAGYAYSGRIAGLAYAQLRAMHEPPRRVVLIGPSHHQRFAGVAACTHDAWRTPLGEMPVCKPSGDVERCAVHFNDNAHALEHSLEVQVPFLQVLPRVPEVLPLLYGRHDEHALGDVEEVAREQLAEWTVLIVSTDLSHFASESEARELDQRTLAHLLELSVEKLLDSGDACGLLGMAALAHLAREGQWAPHLLGYTTSAEASKDASRVVGYAAVAFTGQPAAAPTHCQAP